MRKNVRYIIIAVICLALLAVIYFAVSGIDAPQEEEKNETTATDLLYVEVNEIASVEITPRDEETLEIVAENTSNAQAVNCNLPLDSEKLVRAYASAINPTYTKRIDNVLNLSDYGFDTPSATVKINETDGTDTKYLLGNKSVSGGYYLAFEGENTVYVTEKYMSYSVNCTAEFCADLALVPSEKTVTEFVLESDTLGKVVIEKNNNVKEGALTYQDYIMTEPSGGLSLSEHYMNEYVQKFAQGVNAESMVKANPVSLSEYGLDKPYGRYAITADGTTYEFMVSAPLSDGTCYAIFGNTDAVYMLDFDAYFKALTLTKMELSEQYLFIEKLDDFAEISFKGNGIDKTFKLSGDMMSDDFAVTLNGETFDASEFKTIYSKLIGIAVKGEVSSTESIGDAILTVNMKYRNGNTKNVTYNKINVTKAAVSVDSVGGVYYVYTKDLEMLIELL